MAESHEFTGRRARSARVHKFKKRQKKATDWLPSIFKLGLL